MMAGVLRAEPPNEDADMKSRHEIKRKGSLIGRIFANDPLPKRPIPTELPDIPPEGRYRAADRASWTQTGRRLAIVPHRSSPLQDSGELRPAGRRLQQQLRRARERVQALASRQHGWDQQ